MWLNTLKPLASNFMLTRSVNLKVFDNVISACPVARPNKRVAAQVAYARQTRRREGNAGRSVGVVVTPFVIVVCPQPFAHESCDTPLIPERLEFGRSFWPPSRLKSPPMFSQFPLLHISLRCRSCAGSDDFTRLDPTK